MYIVETVIMIICFGGGKLNSIPAILSYGEVQKYTKYLQNDFSLNFNNNVAGINRAGSRVTLHGRKSNGIFVVMIVTHGYLKVISHEGTEER